MMVSLLLQGSLFFVMLFCIASTGGSVGFSVVLGQVAKMQPHTPVINTEAKVNKAVQGC